VFSYNNLLGKLRFITFKLIKLKNMIPKQTMKTVYFALYQSDFQYGLLVWGGFRDNILNAIVGDTKNERWHPRPVVRAHSCSHWFSTLYRHAAIT